MYYDIIILYVYHLVQINTDCNLIPCRYEAERKEREEQARKELEQESECSIGLFSVRGLLAIPSIKYFLWLLIQIPPTTHTHRYNMMTLLYP